MKLIESGGGLFQTAAAQTVKYLVEFLARRQEINSNRFLGGVYVA